MPFLVLQSSRWGRESWLLYFNCISMSCDCCSVSLPRGAVGWSVVCDSDICWSYSLTFLKSCMFPSITIA